MKCAKAFLVLLLVVSCSAPTGQSADVGVLDLGASDADLAQSSNMDVSTDLSVSDLKADAPDLRQPPSDQLVVVTFNTGTGPTARHDEPPDDGYSSVEAAITDEWYGNGLDWPPVIEDVRTFFDTVQPDVVAFQEIFWTGECPMIPVENHTGFVCEGWTPGDPTVAQLVLGEGYQVACNFGKPDKCVAVRTAFGRIRGCDSDLCLDGLAGSTIDGCGQGGRVGRAVVDRANGDTLTVVNFHGSSGFTTDDVNCRVKQVEQVFVDLGDGEPAANGAKTVILGDLNTDPGRLAASDLSASRWTDFVGVGREFHWNTDVGPEATPTYAVANIDHVASNHFQGGCWHPGVTEGRPAITDIVFFDHKPAVCELFVP